MMFSTGALALTDWRFGRSGRGYLARSAAGLKAAAAMAVLSPLPGWKRMLIFAMLAGTASFSVAAPVHESVR